MAALGTDEFPAFFTRSSGCAAPLRVDSIEQAAALIRTGLGLNLGSGTLIGELAAGRGPRFRRVGSDCISRVACCDRSAGYGD